MTGGPALSAWRFQIPIPRVSLSQLCHWVRVRFSVCPLMCLVCLDVPWCASERFCVCALMCRPTVSEFTFQWRFPGKLWWWLDGWCHNQLSFQQVQLAMTRENGVVENKLSHQDHTTLSTDLSWQAWLTTQVNSMIIFPTQFMNIFFICNMPVCLEQIKQIR